MQSRAQCALAKVPKIVKFAKVRHSIEAQGTLLNKALIKMSGNIFCKRLVDS